MKSFSRLSALKTPVLLAVLVFGMVVRPGSTVQGQTPDTLHAGDVLASIAGAPPRHGGAVPLVPLREAARRLPALIRKVSVQLEDVTVEYALNHLARRAGLDVLYDGKKIDVEKRVTLQLKRVPAYEALREVLLGTGLGLKALPGGQLVLVLQPEAEMALQGVDRRHKPVKLPVSLPSLSKEPTEVQVGTIAGTVTDSTTGAPLPGVNVVIAGTQRGASSDGEGHFVISDLEPGTYDLLASFIGYATKRVEGVAVMADDTARVSIALNPTRVGLEEVVVVGYGTQERENVTGSIAEISGEAFEDRPITNAVNALQGQIPGVTVIQRSGEPGDDGGSIRVRGITTLGNNSPLVLVDGIPSSLADVPSSDIESITVLKDAAAAAIYGVRASAGVILVTTKRGQRGEGLQFSYSGYMGAQVPTRLPDFAESWEYAMLYNEALTNEGKAPRFTQEEIDKFRSGEYPNKYPNTPWLDLLLKDAALQQSHYFALSGGLEKTRYRISFRYLDQNGLVPNINLDEFNARINVDTDINDRLSFSVRASGVRELEHRPAASTGGLFQHALKVPPTIINRYTDGTWGFYKAGNQPIRDALQGGEDVKKQTRLRVSSSVEYELLEGLSIKGRFGLNNYSGVRSTSSAQLIYYAFAPGDEQQGDVAYASATPSVSNRHGYNQTVTLEGFLNYEQSFGRHHVKGLLGYSQQAFREDWFEASRENLPNNELHEIDAGDPTLDDNAGSASEWAIRSFFGRLNYALLDRYLFEVNLRYDGTSRFPKDHRYALFPSFSAGWRLSEEPFFDGVDVIDNLKLRASWGRLGNQEIGLYPFAVTYALGDNYVLGGQLVQGIGESRLPNRAITWETTTVMDVGADAELLEGRLALTAEYFIKRTEGILLNLPVPWTLGIGAPPQNAASVENRGWEFLVDYQDQWGDLSYGISANLSFLHNEITDLADTGPSVDDEFFTAVGYPIGSFYGYEALGLFQSEEEVQNHAFQNPFTQPGDVKYKDQNVDGVIDAQDRVYLGDTFPNLTYGLTLTAGYKGFDFRVFLQSVGRVQGYLKQEAAWAFFNGAKALEWHLDRWTPENRDASYPRLALTQDLNHPPSSYWVQDASYLRVKNVQLGYNLPPAFLERFGAQQLRLYVNADNLFTFTGFRGFDPEAPSGRGNFYPNVTTYTFGVNLTI